MASERKHWPRSVVVFLTLRQDGHCGRSFNTSGCGDALVLPDEDDEDDFTDIELDHIVPLDDGGLDSVRNLQLLHGSCHRSKTAHEATRRAVL